MPSKKIIGSVAVAIITDIKKILKHAKQLCHFDFVPSLKKYQIIFHFFKGSLKSLPVFKKTDTTFLKT